MSDNPYQAPAELCDLPAREGPSARPLGVAILAVLHVLGGVLIAAIGVLLATRTNARGPDWSRGWVVEVVATVAPALAAVSIAAGVGLWRAKKWAWWLATFYYFQFAFGGVVVLASVTAAYLFFDRPLTGRNAELLIKHVVRGAFFAWLTWYMLRRKVLAYFQFQSLTVLRALVLLSGAVVLAALLLSFGVAVAMWGGAPLR